MRSYFRRVFFSLLLIQQKRDFIVYFDEIKRTFLEEKIIFKTHADSANSKSSSANNNSC